MAPRGAARLVIIQAAERLFAERGIEATSLRDVNLAAGQRNHSAAQYHFGDRAGLIAAVFDARMAAINEHRHRLLAELDACGHADLPDVVAALVVPLVDAVAATPSWYGRFLARARWDTLAADVLADHPAASSVRDLNRRLQRQLAEMPSDLRHARIDQLHTLLVGTIAGWEWARDRDERHLPPDTLTADLSATGVAVLTAPPAGGGAPPRPVLTASLRIGPPQRGPTMPSATLPAEPLSGPRVAARTSEAWAPVPYRRLTLRPVAPTIGAEVEGVSLAEPLDDELRQELNQALLEWKVLFFRGQNLNRAQQAAFARHWGELEQHPFASRTASFADRQPSDAPDVVRLEKDEMAKGRENLWHADVTWRECPSLGAVLRAIDVPEVGGDTLWADMAAAYDLLPEAVKDRIDGLVAVHDWVDTFGRAMDPATRDALRPHFPPVEHPVVRTHPETGRKTLFVNTAFTQHIVGLAPEESAELLEYLYRQAAYPEYQCRFRWAPGDIVFWDNRAAQHYASSDYFPQRRVMERVSIAGDRPY